MKTIGLIGGMSWESTAVYYRRINEQVRDTLGGLHSADIALRSLDFSEVVTLQQGGDWAGAGSMLGNAGADLKRAGAHCVLICTNTMHLVAEQVAVQSRLPLIDIIDETAAALRADQRRRPLLLATKYTMEHGFYADRMAQHGIELIIPTTADRQTVHTVIFDELCQGRISDTSRLAYLSVIEKARLQGADSVILGCTEIGLLIDPDQLSLPGYDSTLLHADAAVRFVLEDISRLDVNSAA